jgi:hypothetical protein
MEEKSRKKRPNGNPAGRIKEGTGVRIGCFLASNFVVFYARFCGSSSGSSSESSAAANRFVNQ